MWYTPWEMHRKEEDLGEDCMEGGEGRSCGRQELRTLEENIKIGKISIEELKLDWDQWQQIEEKGEGDIEFVSTVEDLDVQLGTVEVKNRELGREGELTREVSCQKRTEVSKLLAALL